MIIEQGLNLGQAFRRKLPSFRERISRVHCAGGISEAHSEKGQFARQLYHPEGGDWQNLPGLHNACR